jgi:hypothetical protein
MTEPSRSRCCEDFQWTAEVAFGTVASRDLSLGRCGACGMPIMTIVEPDDGSLSRVSLTRAEARLFWSLRDSPDRLKAALEAWVS